MMSMMMWLYPVDGGQPVAWSDDGQTYITVGGVLFGVRDGDLLLSPTGVSLGWFSGDDFFAEDGRPVYFLA
jgi:hypothetical protein